MTTKEVRSWSKRWWVWNHKGGEKQATRSGGSYGEKRDKWILNSEPRIPPCQSRNTSSKHLKVKTSWCMNKPKGGGIVGGTYSEIEGPKVKVLGQETK